MCVYIYIYIYIYIKNIFCIYTNMYYVLPVLRRLLNKMKFNERKQRKMSLIM